MVYQVTIKKKVLKVLEDINEPYYSSIKNAIQNLADNPRPRGYKKLKDRTGYRIHVADYRIIYEVFDNILIVDVINIGHRQDVYK